MTVNKSQGQTIPNVGVYLPAPVFSHGQLYVAMSRATSRTNIKILALPPDAEAQEEEAKKIDKKNVKKNAEGKKYKNASNKKDKDKGAVQLVEKPAGIHCSRLKITVHAFTNSSRFIQIPPNSSQRTGPRRPQ